jgi:hypothetical protein
VRWRVGDKLKMLEQRIGRRRDAPRALTQVPTGRGGLGCPTSHTVGHKAANPRGMGTASPFQKSSLPNSKKTLTKGGESWSGCPLGQDALYHLSRLGRPTESAKDALRYQAPDEELRLGGESVRHVPWGVCAGEPSASTGIDEASRQVGQRRKYDNPSIQVSRGNRLGFGSS